MRSLFILFILMNFIPQIEAQSCHATTTETATAEFAKLGEGEEFRNAHPVPTQFKAVDFKGKMISLDVEGEADGNAYWLEAEEKTDKYIFVFQEWWGLNNYVKQEADRLYKKMEGKVNVLAIDLYDGKVATTRAAAAELMKGAKRERCQSLIGSAIALAGENAEIATIGWCFGGGWSLQAAILAGKQTKACVMYYGMPEKKIERLALLQTDVLAIYATKDRWINKEVAEEFEENMKAVDKKLTSLFYEADHAFCNPSNPSYTEEAAQKANKQAVVYLKNALLK